MDSTTTDANLENINSNPFNKSYNGQNWTIEINLINIKRDLTITLLTLNINLMILFNSIECFCPTFLLMYYDLGQNLAKILDDNNLLLTVNMVQPPPNFLNPYWYKANLLNLNLVFNVDKISTVFKKNNNTMYKFKATYQNQALLLKNVNYATIKDLNNSKNEKKSPLTIINEILHSVEYDFDPIVYDTSTRIHFITSQTMSVYDAIDYLLRRSVSTLDPPTYFVHNLKTGKAMLINNKQIELRLWNPTNIFNIYGLADSKSLDFNLLTLVSDLKNDSFNAGILSLRYLSKFHFRLFDQNKRKWTETTFNYDQINNLFNGYVLNANKNYESIFTIKDKVDINQMEYDFPVHNELKMYEFLRNLQLGTNSISFNVVGNVTRDAGQYVNLNCASESQIPRYEGLWNIYSCKHIWSGKIYTNQLVCYRTWNKKPIFTEKKLNTSE